MNKKHEDRKLSHKGLAVGSIGTVGAIAIGISCIAPDYTLTATLGVAANSVGRFTPSIVWVGLIPMLFVALGYRELNRAIPDSGSSFTWGSRAVGPRFGWLTGWGLIASTIVVLASLAQIAVVFLYETIDWVVTLVSGSEWNVLAVWNNNYVWFNVVSVVVLTAGATWMVYHDLKLTARFQYIMVAFQLLAVFIFGVVAVYKAVTGNAAEGGLPFSWNWLNPVAVITDPAFGWGSLITGLTVAVFIYWGWDVVLTMTEETKNSRSTPGRAAAWAIVLITIYYLFISSAAIMFAGIDDGPLALNGEAIQSGENVFAVLAVPVLGTTGSILVFLAVFSSSIASLESTFVSPARTMLAMGHYRAMGPSFAKTSRFATPGRATLIAGIVAGGYYALMRPLSENILGDTMLTTAIFICFYYGLTSLSAVWYFRRQWFTSFRNFWFKLFFPFVGFLFLGFMFFHELIASMSPDYGSGSTLPGTGIGLVFVLSAVILLVGIGLMIYNNIQHPEFFNKATTTIPVGYAEGDGIDPHFTALTEAILESELQAGHIELEPLRGEGHSDPEPVVATQDADLK